MSEGRKYLVSTGADPEELLKVNFSYLMYNEKFGYYESYNELPDNEQEIVLEMFAIWYDMGLTVEMLGKDMLWKQLERS